jgi:hypothetical protein
MLADEGFTDEPVGGCPAPSQPVNAGEASWIAETMIAV